MKRDFKIGGGLREKSAGITKIYGVYLPSGTKDGIKKRTQSLAKKQNNHFDNSTNQSKILECSTINVLRKPQFSIISGSAPNFTPGFTNSKTPMPKLKTANTSHQRTATLQRRIMTVNNSTRFKQPLSRLARISLIDIDRHQLEGVSSIGYHTHAGMVCGESKLNQDSMFIKNTIIPGITVVALFDGHGMTGHRVSNFLSLNLEGRFRVYARMYR